VAGFDPDEAESALPSFLWVPVGQVADAAVDGLDRGRAMVIPGIANRLGAVSARLAPRSLLVPLIARQHPGLQR
jgi:hypothetical protein